MTSVFILFLLVATQCASFPCYNDGICSEDGQGFTCECPAGFDGPRCEVEGIFIYLLFYLLPFRKYVQGRRSYGGSYPRCPNCAGAARG